MRTVELVSEWDAVPFDGGYEGLRSLSDQGFSGAVTAGPTQLFMLNGTVVGILDGDIEAFDGTDGTARAAPHDALPLLVVMQDRAGSPRAQYYTEDTPIADVDRTLEDGNFTGFVELSENVLSGDYYIVYHQGRSMSVAWVGNSQKLVTDEEAFEQADDEVGIYQVMPADIEPVEIPEPPEPTDDAAGTAAAGAATAADDEADDSQRAAADGAATDSATGEGPPDPPTESADEGAVAAGDPAGTGAAGETPERGGDAAGPPGSKAAGASQGTAVDRQQREEPAAEATDSGATAKTARREATETAGPADTTTPAETEPPETTPAETAEPAEPAGAETADSAESRAAPEPTAREVETAETAEPAEPSGEGDEQSGATRQPESPPEEEAASQRGAVATDSDAVGDLETRSIPSLDPERSSSTPEATTTTTAAQTSSAESSQSRQPTPSGDSETEAPTADEPTEPLRDASAASEESRSAPSPELKAKVEEREAEIAELEAEIHDLASENDELVAERDRLLGELEEARAEIQRLEEELAAAGGAAPDGETLSPAAAIDGTNLFVRYHSKGEATLEKAKSGATDRASVEENLRLEHHTQFDAADTVVDGEAFEAFLRDSIQYRFVDWLVRNLLYEIRDTGHESAMGVLYDALPKVDRAELNGKVSVTYTEDGEEHRSQETFDVVVRDRMGNPLVVANINDSRQPATEGQMTNIVRNAERVGDASDSLAAAFLVTSSFFEPEALETAKEATSSGLFSRDKRKSFVNLSRKGGYHLCLLEARNREFHLAVPEL